MHRTTAILALSLAAGLLTVHGAAAADVAPLYHSEIVAKAELIVIASAIAVSSRYEENGRTIRSYVRFDDLDVRKGRIESPTLTLRFDGGRVGAERIEVAAMPRPRVGKRYLLFVSGNGRHVSPIVGFNQGIFEVTTQAGRQVLIGSNGLELIGVERNRLVFAAARSPASGPSATMPTLGEIRYAVQAADANATLLELANAARLRHVALPSRLPEVVSIRSSASPSMTPQRAAAAPPVAGLGEEPRPEASPVHRLETQGKGPRATIDTMLRKAR